VGLDQYPIQGDTLSDILLIGVSAIVLAQFIKIVIEYKQNKVIGFATLMQNGGMPSSHTAGIVGATAGIYIEQGYTALFGLAVILCLIIINDALKVRRQTGVQAEILNRIMKIDHIDHARLTKNIGHTPSQVTVGAIIGILVAMLIASL
jgi:uncharacterized protein